MATMERAVAFADSATESYRRSTGAEPPKAAISEGPDGSVDVVWRTQERLLLANVPEEPDDVVTLYGRCLDDDGPRMATEVGIESGYGAWALQWLTGIVDGA